MVMKQISKLLVIVMVVILFVPGLPGGVISASSLPSPASLAFQDVETQSNHYFGEVNIGKAPDESNITSYFLYWANDSSIITPGTPFASVPKTGANISYTLFIYGNPFDIKLAVGATRLAVVSYDYNNNSESAPVFIPLIDNIFGNITPPPIPTYNSVSVLNFPVDRPGKAYFDVVPYGVTPLTYGQLITGGKATSVSKLVNSYGTIPVSIPGLSANTLYTMYMVNMDTSKHYSSIKTFDFQTFEAPKGDDVHNTVSNMTSSLEYNYDNRGYVMYNNESFSTLDFSGNHTLLVRVAADTVTGTPVGDEITLKFTTNNNAYTIANATAIALKKTEIIATAAISTNEGHDGNEYIIFQLFDESDSAQAPINSVIYENIENNTNRGVYRVSFDVTDAFNSNYRVKVYVVQNMEKQTLGLDLALPKSIVITKFNQLNINNDREIGIDDIINIITGNSPMIDINNDEQFDQKDIKILLDQITPKVILDPLVK